MLNMTYLMICDNRCKYLIYDVLIDLLDKMI